MLMNPDKPTTRKLSTLVNMQMGPTILQKDLSEAGLPVFSAGNQEFMWGYTNKKVKSFNKETLVVSARGTIGVPKLPLLDSFTCTQTTIAIQTRDELDIRYLYYFLQSVNWDDVVSGVAIPMLTISKLGEIEIGLPTIDEQIEIVGILDAMLPRVKLTKSRLEKIPTILKKFRQSVLSAACSGKLTENWRYDNHVFEWGEMRLGDMTDLITKGASPNWQGVKYIDEPGVLFVTSENVYCMELRLTKKKFLEGRINFIQERSILQKGDLLTNIVGASIGRTAIYDLDDAANVNQAVAIIRLKKDFSRSFYLLYLNSPEYITFLQNEKVDVARANISLTMLKEMMVPVPSINEQKEIVKRVQSLFKLADSVESKHRNAMALIEKIEQSILAKAFRSELISNVHYDQCGGT